MKWLLSAVAVVLVCGALTLLAMGARDGRGRATAAIEIGRAPSAIFPFLVQPELRKQWLLGVASVTPEGDPTLRSGAKSRVVLDIPEHIEVEEELRVVDINQRLLLQRSSSHPEFAQSIEYALKDEGGNRALVTAATHTTYTGLVFSVLEPLMTRANQIRLQQEMLQLRTLVESPPATQAPALPVMATPMIPAETAPQDPGATTSAGASPSTGTNPNPAPIPSPTPNPTPSPQPPTATAPPTPPSPPTPPAPPGPPPPKEEPDPAPPPAASETQP